MLARFINDDPLAWVRFLGFEADSAELLDSDLTTYIKPGGEITYRGQTDNKPQPLLRQSRLDKRRGSARVSPKKENIEEKPEPKKDPYSLKPLNEQLAVDAAASLIDKDPAGFLSFFGLPMTKDTTVKIVKMPEVTEESADHLVKVSGPPAPYQNPDYEPGEDEDTEYILHIDMVTDAAMVLFHRIIYQNVTAMFKHDLKVRYIVVLLRKSADDAAINGYHKSGGFQMWYDVARMWERSPDEILSAPPVLYPFLPVTNVTAADLPAYLAKLRPLMAPLPADYQHELWMRMRVLMGLVYNVETTDNYLKESCSMPDLRESSTYKEIAELGRLEGKWDLVMKLLQSRFQPLPDSIGERVSTLSADQMDELALSLILMSGISDLERWLSDAKHRSS